ncbi:MAG: hypothetical protein IKM25_01365 [Clostridia bacterium]|nr:hypothetical protein [Clostridia bacterium]
MSFYRNWMSYIKDDAKITRIAMPGSHNSPTMAMNKFACCQKGTVYEQFCYGLRMFDIRLKVNKKGELIAAHGVMNGVPAERVFLDLKKIIEETNEFIIIYLRTYMNQGIGPITLSYKSNNEEASRLIKTCLSPEKYALTDISDIANLTVGDIRKSGKKYIIINENRDYDYSVDCPIQYPWSSEVYGLKTEKFVKTIFEYFDEIETEGFFGLQTQQTPNPGTENGWLKWPDDLDEMIRPYIPQIIADIAANPKWLEKVNIIVGDFMTKDYMKSNEILSLNLLKGIVKEELKEEYAKAIGKY